jgi:hypothetical protein
MTDEERADVIRNASKSYRASNKELTPYNPSASRTPEPVPEPVPEEIPEQKEELLPEEPEPEKPSVVQSQREVRETNKRKRGQSPASFKETFLVRNEIKTRQCVYISHRVHALIAKLVRTLVDAGNEITVGGYIDTVLDEHMQLHKDEINELYRQQRGDLL